MKILGFDHFQFVVKDFDESVEFFKKLGFELEKTTKHHEGSAEFRISPGGAVLEIHASERYESPGHDHYAILVEDLDSAVEELRSKGLEINDPQIATATGRRLANFRDNTGFRWQLIAPKE